MARICIASHHPAQTTSFARVCRNFAMGIEAAGHLVAVAGSTAGLPSDAVTRAERFEGHIVSTTPSRLAETAALLAAETRSDLLITIGDPWMFDGMPKPPCPWLACFPLDGGPVPRTWTRWMSSANRCLVFSRFAQTLVTAATGLEPIFLPHGVDTRVFSPADKPSAKLQLIGDDRSFIVGCIATNAQRKNLPALIRAFASFSADKPDALLYLHTPIVGFWDIEELTDRYGVTPKTRATLNYHPHYGVPDETLAVIYNAMDVLALPTMGEGFGLPLLEAAACGVSAIATDCSSCPELLPDPIQRIAVAARLTMARNIEQAIVDEADLAAKLNRFYRDAQLRRQIGEQGRAMAQTLDWSIITGRFVGIINDMTAGPDVR